jgi:hypothetical protein
MWIPFHHNFVVIQGIRNETNPTVLLGKKNRQIRLIRQKKVTGTTFTTIFNIATPPFSMHGLKTI